MEKVFKSDNIANIIFAISIACAHFFLVGLYPNANLYAISQFNVEKPFCYRMLLPAIAYPLITLLGTSFTIPVFLMFEIIFCFVLLRVFQRLFVEDGFANDSSHKLARIGLSLTLLPTNLITQTPLFYPWDIPSSAFVMLAVLFARKVETLKFFIVFCLAVINRETSLIIAFIYPLIALRSGIRSRLQIGIACLCIWGIVRFVNIQLWASQPGLALYLDRETGPAYLYNLNLILNNPVRFFSSMAFVPIGLIVFFAKFSKEFKLLLLIEAMFFTASLMAGLADEPRSFLEFYVLGSYLLLSTIARYIPLFSNRSATAIS